MIDRTMIIVAGGSSTRFGSDKLVAQVAGRSLLHHTLEAVAPHVDQVVLAVRADLIEEFESDQIIIVVGGDDRTASEMNALAATPASALIGIHDGARPLVSGALIDALFTAAAENGGAVPGLDPDGLGVDNEFHHPTKGPVRVQTPQVFWGPELKAAYVAAKHADFTGPDTAAVVRQFTNLEIVVVPGEPENIKVTHPDDLERVADLLDPTD